MPIRIRERIVSGDDTPQSGSPGTRVGGGWLIGDDIVLSAGHVYYEYNRNAPPQLDRIRFGSDSLVLDPMFGGETYREAYLRVASSAHTLGNLASRENGELESELVNRDFVLVEAGGDVDNRDAGLALFMNASD